MLSVGPFSCRSCLPSAARTRSRRPTPATGPPRPRQRPQPRTDSGRPAPPPLDGTIEGSRSAPRRCPWKDSGTGPPDLPPDRGRSRGERPDPLPVPETEKVGGREWTFGGKVDDPVVSITRPDKDKPDIIFGPDYTMTLKLKTQSQDAVEGEIDLIVKSRRGPGSRGHSGRPTPGRRPPRSGRTTPRVCRQDHRKRPKKTEKLAAGFVGIGADGKPYGNEAAFPVDIGQPVLAPSPNPQSPPSYRWLASTEDAIPTAT